MFLTVARGLIAHAFPILIAQLSSIGMMVIDTAVLGHVSALDLAAVAIGGGIHVALVFALAGVLQAVGPVVAHLHGARRDGEVAGVLHQGFWLAMLLSGVKVDTVGLDNAWTPKTAVFVCNHVTNLDPAALFFTLPRVAVILKKELGKIPLLGYVMRMGGFIYVDRAAGNSRHKAMEDAVELSVPLVAEVSRGKNWFDCKS